MLKVQKNKEQLITEILNLQVTTSILNNIDDVLWVKNLNGHYVLVSDSFARRRGHTADQITGKTDFDIHPHHLALQYTHNDHLVMDDAKTHLFLEYELLSDGSEQCFEVRRSPVYDVTGRIVGTLGVSRDISERKRLESDLLYVSEHDALTGIYNRRYFEKKITNLSRQGITNIGLLLWDIDGLKIINETLGHQAGDKVLLQVARLLDKLVGARGTVARIGGDEFAAIIPNIPLTDMETLCQQIDAGIRLINSGLGDIPMSVSSGCATTNLTRENFEQLFKRVDDAMQKEKLLRSQSHRSALALTAKEMLKARDFITEEHGDRLQKLVIQLATAAGLPAINLNELQLFAQFHDLGKVGISDNILFKPGPLTPPEREEMRRHSQIGFRIAQSIPELAAIADWILKHHEWFDGTGYPLGLSGASIPAECRILSIVDAYDAMISDRPYRRALAPAEAVAELKKYAGRQFDPELTNIFINMLGV
ncbi:HD domain-containing phosphohydrolase [Sporomusa aerivorans]|uniref:HD domain-containing phosphohydrolase n=1 Tax=Sporomusa aerivorans TaxID=204936 RepID=UPI00352B1F68